MTNLFLEAAKKKYRFQTNKGLLTIEQLFELGKTELNDLYLSIESGIQKSKGLLGRRGNTEIENKLEIVKEVFNCIVDDQKAEQNRLEKNRMKQVILEAADKKEVEELIDGKSAKQLRKEAAKL